MFQCPNPSPDVNNHKFTLDLLFKTKFEYLPEKSFQNLQAVPSVFALFQLTHTESCASQRSDLYLANPSWTLCDLSFQSSALGFPTQSTSVLIYSVYSLSLISKDPRQAPASLKTISMDFSFGSVDILQCNLGSKPIGIYMFT